MRTSCKVCIYTARCKSISYLLPDLNVKTGPSSSAFLMKNSARLSKPLINGNDPTSGRDGSEGGGRRLTLSLDFHHWMRKWKPQKTPTNRTASAGRNISVTLRRHIGLTRRKLGFKLCQNDNKKRFRIFNFKLIQAQI